MLQENNKMKNTLILKLKLKRKTYNMLQYKILNDKTKRKKENVLLRAVLLNYFIF